MPDRLWITARDGIRLAADVYLPASRPGVTAAALVPALLEALPYRKDDLTSSSHLEDYVRLCGEGNFAVCRLDVRGTGSSEGRATDEYPPSELDDLADVIAWLAAQPWCNGRVGMFGYSYSGFNSLQVACERPAGLDAICAIYATDDRYTDDVHYMGGARRAIDLVDYCHYMTACNVLPPVPAVFGDGWRVEWMKRIEEGEPWLLRWMREQRDGPYWRHGSVRPDYRRIACPTMIVAGWADGYRNATFRAFEALQCEKSLLIGPWSHMAPASSLPGPHIDLVPEMIRWFDRWLRDVDNGVDREPPIRVFVRHSTRPEPDLRSVEGEWRAEAGWPPARGRELVLIPADETAGEVPVSPRETLGVPDRTVVGDDGRIDTLVVRSDVGTAAWISCAGGLPWGQPLDQREDDAWSLTYEWPVSAPVEVLGHPHVRVRVAADRPVASLSLKLCDVAPDGTSAMATRGFLNLTRRDSLVSPSPLVPGRFEEVEVELEATSWVFPPGHRIRLSVAGTDWPNTWAPPEPVTLQVDRSSLHLQLPVVDGPGEGVPRFTAPAPASDAARPADAEDVARDESKPVWRIERDILARTTVARTRYGGGSFPIRDGGRAEELYEGEVGVSTVGPPDGWATARTRYELSWPEATCTVEALLHVRSDREAFHVEIALDAHADGELVATRSWSERIARDLL